MNKGNLSVLSMIVVFSICSFVVQLQSDNQALANKRMEIVGRIIDIDENALLILQKPENAPTHITKYWIKTDDDSDQFVIGQRIRAEIEEEDNILPMIQGKSISIISHN